MSELTLQAGDYIRTEGLSYEQCEDFAVACIEAGAEFGEGMRHYKVFREKLPDSYGAAVVCFGLLGCITLVVLNVM